MAQDRRVVMRTSVIPSERVTIPAVPGSLEEYNITKAIYYPNSKVFHRANSEHRRNNKLFFYSIQSTLKYFNKWGYFDKSRNALNIKTIQQVKKASKGI